MNKTQLIERIAEKTGFSKSQSKAFLEAAVETVAESLKSGEEVSVLGFGTFKVSERAERSVKVPSTGKTMKVPPVKVVRFKPGKTLKETVSGKK